MYLILTKLSPHFYTVVSYAIYTSLVTYLNYYVCWMCCHFSWSCICSAWFHVSRVCGFVSLHDVQRKCCYLVIVSCSTLDIGLCVFMFISFICRLLLLVLCIWHFHSVHKVFPFPMFLYDVHYICYGSVFVSLVCNMWFEYTELLILFLIACTCPFYVVWNSLPVLLMHFSDQSNLLIR